MSERKHPILDFIRREYRKLSGTVRSLLRDAADRDAEDIVQDLLLSVMNAPDPVQPVENVSAWVYRSLRNRVVDHYRKKKKAPLSLDEAFDTGDTLGDIIASTRYDTHSEAEQNALGEAIRKAVDELPPDQKAVFTANEMEGLTFFELSEIWGEPVGTLLARKHRAVKTLRKKLAHWIH